MGDNDAKRLATTTVRHSLDGEWSQHDFGEAFEVSSLSVIAELDPLGERGVLRDVLKLFLTSLEPELDRLEHLDLDGDSGKQLASRSTGLEARPASLEPCDWQPLATGFKSIWPPTSHPAPRRPTLSFAVYWTNSWQKSFGSSAACERC